MGNAICVVAGMRIMRCSGEKSRGRCLGNAICIITGIRGSRGSGDVLRNGRRLLLFTVDPSAAAENPAYPDLGGCGADPALFFYKYL